MPKEKRSTLRKQSCWRGDSDQMLPANVIDFFIHILVWQFVQLGLDDKVTRNRKGKSKKLNRHKVICSENHDTDKYADQFCSQPTDYIIYFPGYGFEAFSESDPADFAGEEKKNDKIKHLVIFIRRPAVKPGQYRN